MVGSAIDTRLMRAGEVMTIERPTSRCKVCGSPASIGAFAGTGVGACCVGGVALCAGAWGSAGRLRGARRGRREPSESRSFAVQRIVCGLVGDHSLSLALPHWFGKLLFSRLLPVMTSIVYGEGGGGAATLTVA